MDKVKEVLLKATRKFVKVFDSVGLVIVEWLKELTKRKVVLGDVVMIAMLLVMVFCGYTACVVEDVGIKLIALLAMGVQGFIVGMLAAWTITTDHVESGDNHE